MTGKAAARAFPTSVRGFGLRWRIPSAQNVRIIDDTRPTVWMEHEAIVYQFSRSKVERGDFSHFLSLYGTDKLPTGRRLRDLMDRFVFCIEGWDDDPREIHMIPEIRQFYSAFHDAWPYWFYFCNLQVDTLRAMTLCCMPSATTMQVDGQTLVKVTCEPVDLLNFLKRDLKRMNEICDRGAMFERYVYQRTKAVFDYFDVPFEEAPPP